MQSNSVSSVLDYARARPYAQTHDKRP
jgi:hypothetical protein